MQALVLHEWGGPLVPTEVPTPEPGPGEVLLRVRACGVGLTLTNIRTGRFKGSPGANLPRIIGHEVAGDVVKTGAGVDGWSPGDRVLVYFYLTCGRCPACQWGHDPLCESMRGLVGVATDGGFAEYMTVPAANLAALPAEVDYAAGSVVADAVATPWHSLKYVARVQPLEVVVVFGAGGGVGIHAVQVAKFLGARVVAVDISPEKLALAAQNGAEWGLNAREADVAAEVKRLTKNRGADVVVDYVTNQQTMQAGHDCLAIRGRQVFQGVNPPGVYFQADPRRLFQHELMVTGARYASRREFDEAVELVRQGLLKPVITRTGALEQTEEFFALMDRQTLLGRAAIVF